MSTLAPTLLACSGHLLIDLPIFMGPVVVLVGWLALMTRRARKHEQLEAGATDTGPEANSREVPHTLLGVHA